MAMDWQGHVHHFLSAHRSPVRGLMLGLVASTVFATGCASGGRSAFPNFFASKDGNSIADEGLESTSRMAEAGYPAGSGTKGEDVQGSGRSLMAAAASGTMKPTQSGGARQEPSMNRYTGADTRTVTAKTAAVATPQSRAATPASVASYSKAAFPTDSGPPLVVLQDSGEFMPLLTSTSGPVLLDFYTTWCGPCKKQSKILHEMEEVAARTGARIIKIDAEKHREIAKQFQVKVYPTLVLLKDGAIQANNPGAIFDKQKLASWLTP
ncbi:MAG: thioredoxin family protein [Pirellulaceae bacterium]